LGERNASFGEEGDEGTNGVSGGSDRGDGSGVSITRFFSELDLLLLWRQKRRNITRSRAASPPSVPPSMAPRGERFVCDPAVDDGVVEALLEEADTDTKGLVEGEVVLPVLVGFAAEFVELPPLPVSKVLNVGCPLLLDAR